MPQRRRQLVRGCPAARPNEPIMCIMLGGGGLSLLGFWKKSLSLFQFRHMENPSTLFCPHCGMSLECPTLILPNTCPHCSQDLSKLRLFMKIRKKHLGSKKIKNLSWEGEDSLVIQFEDDSIAYFPEVSKVE